MAQAYYEAAEADGSAYTSMGAMCDAPDGAYPGIEHSTDAAIDCYLRSYTAESLTEGACG